MGQGGMANASMKLGSCCQYYIWKRTLLEVSQRFNPPTSKILDENDITNIVGNYETGFKERVKGFKNEFKKTILEKLNEEHEQVSNKKKKKITDRIEKVKAL